MKPVTRGQFSACEARNLQRVYDASQYKIDKQFESIMIRVQNDAELGSTMSCIMLKDQPLLEPVKAALNGLGYFVISCELDFSTGREYGADVIWDLDMIEKAKANGHKG